MDRIQVKDLREDGPVDYGQVLDDAADLLRMSKDKDAECDEDDLDDQEEDDYDEAEGHVFIIYPRTQRTFYNTLLKGMLLWKRPPHDHCSRCDDFDTNVHRISELTSALNGTASNPEYKKHQALILEAGGPTQAWTELRDLQLQQPDLKKHVDWSKEQRSYVTFRKENLEPHQALLELDYGGFVDSGGNKVSAWSASVFTSGRKKLPEHIDFFFDAANQKKNKRPGAKKDGQTGIFFLHELLDGSRSPDGSGKSLLKRLLPLVNHLILSGDTGNGYRAYEMLEELGKSFSELMYSMELIPLAPGHAWNNTDSRFAHLNIFLTALKSTSRVFGAEQIAAAFHEASNAQLAKRRKFMVRSLVFFRVVRSTGSKERAQKKKELGATLKDNRLDGGSMGVRGLIFFDFSFEGIVHVFTCYLKT